MILLQEEIVQQRKGSKAADQKDSASKEELAKATRQLAELTSAYQLLKGQRELEKETYSLVPYRGKRGGQRKPIYVECVAEGVVFHPEKKVMPALEFTVAGLVREIENHAG